MAEIPIERLKELRGFANKGRDLHSHTAIDLLQEIDRLREALAEKTTQAGARLTAKINAEAERDAAIRERDEARSLLSQPK